MTSSDAVLMNICTIIFQGGGRTTRRVLLMAFSENCRQHAMPCTLHTWHMTGMPSQKRNSINFVILEGAEDARSLLLTAGPHYYANNTSSSRNDLFVRMFMTKYIK